MRDINTLTERLTQILGDEHELPHRVMDAYTAEAVGDTQAMNESMDRFESLIKALPDTQGDEVLSAFMTWYTGGNPMITTHLGIGLDLGQLDVKGSC